MLQKILPEPGLNCTFESPQAVRAQSHVSSFAGLSVSALSGISRIRCRRKQGATFSLHHIFSSWQRTRRVLTLVPAP